MLTSRFTSTLRCARRREPVDRLTVTIAGRSCGVRPIAIASENSSASMNGRCSNTLMTKIETVSTPATRTSRYENSRSPAWNAVSACRSPSPTAMRPNVGLRAGAHDDAARRAFAHDRSHERARPSRRSSTAPSRLLDGQRLAGQRRLRRTRARSTSSSRMSAGTMSPICEHRRRRRARARRRRPAGARRRGSRARCDGSASAAPRRPVRIGTR